MLPSLAFVVCKPCPSLPQPVLDCAEVGVVVQDRELWEEGIQGDGAGSLLSWACDHRAPAPPPGPGEVCGGPQTVCDRVEQRDGSPAAHAFTGTEP